jgi:hypothetical protein
VTLGQNRQLLNRLSRRFIEQESFDLDLDVNPAQIRGCSSSQVDAFATDTPNKSYPSDCGNDRTTQMWHNEL